MEFRNYAMNSREREKEPLPRVCPCQKWACELQRCLEKKQWQQDRCAQVLLSLQSCCAATYGGAGETSRVSPTCSGFVERGARV